MKIRKGLEALGIRTSSAFSGEETEYTIEHDLRIMTAARLTVPVAPRPDRAKALQGYMLEHLRIAGVTSSEERTRLHLEMAQANREMAEEARHWIQPDYSDGGAAMDEAVRAFQETALAATLSNAGKMRHIDLVLQSTLDAIKIAVELFDHRLGVTPRQWIQAAAHAVALDTTDMENAGRTGSSQSMQGQRRIVSWLQNMLSQPGEHVLMMPDGTTTVINGDEIVRKGKPNSMREERQKEWDKLDALERNEVRERSISRALELARKNGELDDQVGQGVEKVAQLALEKMKELNALNRQKADLQTMEDEGMSDDMIGDEQVDEARLQKISRDFESFGPGKRILDGERRLRQDVLVKAYMALMESEGTPVSLSYAQAVVDFTLNGSWSEPLHNVETGEIRAAVEEAAQVQINRNHPNALHEILWENPDWDFIRLAEVARANGVLVEFVRNKLYELGLPVNKDGQVRAPNNTEMQSVDDALAVYSNLRDWRNPWNIHSGSAWEGLELRRQESSAGEEPEERVNGVSAQMIGLPMLEPIDPTRSYGQRTGTFRSAPTSSSSPAARSYQRTG